MYKAGPRRQLADDERPVARGVLRAVNSTAMYFDFLICKTFLRNFKNKTVTVLASLSDMEEKIA